MIFFQNIYTLLTTKNILKLEYETNLIDEDDIDCYYNLSNFMKCYISPIYNFFIYKLKKI